MIKEMEKINMMRKNGEITADEATKLKLDLMKDIGGEKTESDEVESMGDCST